MKGILYLWLPAKLLILLDGKKNFEIMPSRYMVGIVSSQTSRSMRPLLPSPKQDKNNTRTKESSLSHISIVTLTFFSLTFAL